MTLEGQLPAVPGVPPAPDAPPVTGPPAPAASATASLPAVAPGWVPLLVSVLAPQCNVLASKNSDGVAPQSLPIVIKRMSSIGAVPASAVPRGRARPLLGGRCMKPAILCMAIALAAGCSGSAPVAEVQVVHREDAASDAQTDAELVWPDSFTFLIPDASSDDAREASGDGAAKPLAQGCAKLPDFGCLTDENNCEVGTPLRPVCVDGQYQCQNGSTPNETCGPRFSCGTRRCFAPAQYCRHSLGEGGALGDEYACVSVPSTCARFAPTCACVANERCGASCEFTDGGAVGLTLTCP